MRLGHQGVGVLSCLCYEESDRNGQEEMEKAAVLQVPLIADIRISEVMDK